MRNGPSRVRPWVRELYDDHSEILIGPVLCNCTGFTRFYFYRWWLLVQNLVLAEGCLEGIVYTFARPDLRITIWHCL